MATHTPSEPLFGVGLFWTAFWAVVLAGSVWFVYESVDYALYYVTDPDPEPISSRGIVVYTHAAMAIPILFLAPLQFHPAYRKRWPKAHRWTGRVFLAASILAASIAVWLSVGYEPIASRPAIFVFGLIWIGFSLAAWLCAWRGDFAAHRAFMIRSVAVGFAFVWVRLLRVTQEWLLPFIEDDTMRLVVREYLCFILPLIAVEIWLTYWPALKRSVRRR